MNAAIVGVRTIGVPVTDQNQAVEFYVGTLGMDKRMDVEAEQLGERWIEVAAPGSATTIALVPARPAAAGVDTGIRLTAADAAALHQYLAARGVDVDAMVRWDGIPPMFTFRDPDGNGLTIVE